MRCAFFAAEKPGYLHISAAIMPALPAAGVTQEQTDQMLVGNPRRLFTPG
jgi:phosphotriesterase-related protein